jgi:hypothetical protein
MHTISLCLPGTSRVLRQAEQTSRLVATCRDGPSDGPILGYTSSGMTWNGLRTVTLLCTPSKLITSGLRKHFVLSSVQRTGSSDVQQSSCGGLALTFTELHSSSLWWPHRLLCLTKAREALQGDHPRVDRSMMAHRTWMLCSEGQCFQIHACLCPDRLAHERLCTVYTVWRTPGCRWQEADATALVLLHGTGKK